MTGKSASAKSGTNALGARHAMEFDMLRTSPLECTIRLLVADDHSVMRQGLCVSLGQEPDFVIVGEAADGQEALESALRLHPDVVLMDIGMPGMNGMEATRRIRSTRPEIRIIGLSMHEEEEQAAAMKDAGAAAYLNKRCSIAELTSTIRRTVRSAPHIGLHTAIDPDSSENNSD